MVKQILIAALLTTAACGSNSRLETVSSQHPVATDLTCPAEPSPPTDEQIIASASDPDAAAQLDRNYTTDAIMAGRACRDALKRSCEWFNPAAKLDCTNAPFVREPSL